MRGMKVTNFDAKNMKATLEIDLSTVQSEFETKGDKNGNNKQKCFQLAGTSGWGGEEIPNTIPGLRFRGSFFINETALKAALTNPKPAAPVKTQDLLSSLLGK